jgi:hypothetical protein
MGERAAVAAGRCAMAAPLAATVDCNVLNCC